MLLIIGVAFGIRQANDVVPSDISAATAINVGLTPADVRFGAMAMPASVFPLFWFQAYLHLRLRDTQSEAG